MAMIRVRDTGGAPIPLLNIRLALGAAPSAAAYDDKFTDLAGNTAWPVVLPSDVGYTLWANAANVNPRFGQIAQWVTDFSQDIDLVVPRVPLWPLTIQDRDFVNARGQRQVLCGCDGFCDYRIFLDGGEPALAPFLQESAELGFTSRRVFLQGSQAQNHVLDLRPTEPGYYEHLAPFVEVENRWGILPLLTIGVDNQDVRSPISHWTVVDEITEGLPRILSYWNEWSKNISDFRPEDIPPASGFWSRGSDVGNGVPRQPQGPVIEFHPVRNYDTAMRDAVASPIQLYEVLGYHGPLLIDEPGRMGTNAHDARFTDPVEVERYARLLSTLCAGAVMHNLFGQSGRLMDAPTRACAEAWVRGMRL